MKDENKPVVVIGDGWAALACVGFLAKSGENTSQKIIWITGTGARMLPALPSVDAGQEASAWKLLAESFGIAAGEPVEGSYLREFRNKAFREPSWIKAPSPEMRLEARDELLWAPERAIACAFEARFALTLGEIEEEIRARLAAGELANLRKIERVPVAGFGVEEGRVQSVILGSGEEIACECVFFADRWSALAGLKGMPKGASFMRRREPMGILQATFSHETPVALDVQEGFFGDINKDAGDEIERHVWGYFSTNGKQSVWTICLSPEEAEDNHQIAKKLRRLKNALEKMFAGEGSVGLSDSAGASFLSNVRDEQVRFAEGLIFAEGEPVIEPISMDGIEGVSFLTDGYGPGNALLQAARALGIELPVEEEREQDQEQAQAVMPVHAEAAELVT